MELKAGAPASESCQLQGPLQAQRGHVASNLGLLRGGRVVPHEALRLHSLIATEHPTPYASLAPTQPFPEEASDARPTWVPMRSPPGQGGRMGPPTHKPDLPAHQLAGRQAEVWVRAAESVASVNPELW